MNNAPIVSMIVPSYNAIRFIRETLDSIQHQTYQSIELIVVDDCSIDGTRDYLKTIEGSAKILRNDENLGASASRNRGAKTAIGDFLMFVDSDDLLEPDTVRSLLTSLDESGADLAICSWKYLRHGDGITVEDSGRGMAPPNGDYILGWLGDWWVPPCGVMWRRSSFDATGGWDESLAANQDGDIVLRALLSGASIVQSPGGLAMYRKHSTSSISETTSRSSLESRFRVGNKIEMIIREKLRLPAYAAALGRMYYDIARAAYPIDSVLAKKCERHAYRLAGRNAVTGSLAHRVTSKLIGLEFKERLSAWLHGVHASSE